MYSVKGKLFIPLGLSIGLLVLALGVLQGAMPLIVAGLAVLAGLTALTLAGLLRHYHRQVRALWKEHRAPGAVRRPRLQPGWRLKRPALRRSSVVGRRSSARRSPFGRAYRLLCALVIAAMLAGMVPLPGSAYAAPPQRPAQQTQAQAASAAAPSGKGQPTIAGPPGVTVNLYNGNLHYQRVDMPISMGGYPFPVLQSELSYNSFESDIDRGFGPGWRFGYDMSYHEDSYGNITIFWPDGREVRFESQEDGQFTPPPGVYDRLTQPSADAYVLTTLEGAAYYFPRHQRVGPIITFPRHWSVTRIEAENGLALTFTYNANGRLTTVQDAYGRALHLTHEVFYDYWGDPIRSRVTRITNDFLNRSLTLTYNDDGNLATITDPAGQVTSYSYHSGGPLAQVTLPDGREYRLEYHEVVHCGVSVSVSAGGGKSALQAASGVSGSCSIEYGRLTAIRGDYGSWDFLYHDKPTGSGWQIEGATIIRESVMPA